MADELAGFLQVPLYIPLFIIVPPLLHTAPDMCDFPEQAAHYHFLIF
jgi:hypothetical protein